MRAFKSFRHSLSGFAGWCIFLVVYLGGALLLLLGLIFSARAWWGLINQHGSLLAVGATTAEVFVVATAFFLILTIPLLQRRSDDRVNSKRDERKSGTRRGFPVTE